MSLSAVNSPAHYTDGNPDYEVIKILKAKLTPEEYRGYVKGNVLKYIFRAGKKAGASEHTDVSKANKYIQYLLEVSNMIETSK